MLNVEKGSGAPSRESSQDGRGVCVIIAAMNARATIGRAVRSALKQPEAAEIVVVDDASQDDTSDAARAEDDGSGRLKVISLAENRGPAAARNLAISQSTSPYLAILDADDFFLDGRFSEIGYGPPYWDAVADNIVFTTESQAGEMVGRPTFSWSDDNHLITAERFIEGNIVRGGGQRGELGFVKPVISRDFLTDHGLSYNERLRLGEDFDLYVRMLLCGARFKLSGQCGYVAVERNNSLSAVHSADDLKSLLAANDEILSLDLTEPEARAMRRHRASIAARWHHRELLQRRRNVGALKAVAEAARTPQLLFDGVVGITRDKMRAFRPAKPHRESETPRFLIADAGAASALLDA